MSRRKVCIINSGPDYVRMYRAKGWKVVRNVADADLIQFTGGEDVTPALYGETAHSSTHFYSIRDRREALVFATALKRGIPMAGICRGGQFLNVMCGGTMWQHVDKHGISGTHMAWDSRTMEEFQVTSTHHQIMRPSKENPPDVIVCAIESTQKVRMGKNGNEVTIFSNNQYEEDIEALIYPMEQVFCFQPHPEFAGHDELARRYFDYLDEFLLQAQ